MSVAPLYPLSSAGLILMLEPVAEGGGEGLGRLER